MKFSRSLLPFSVLIIGLGLALTPACSSSGSTTSSPDGGGGTGGTVSGGTSGGGTGGGGIGGGGSGGGGSGGGGTGIGGTGGTAGSGGTPGTGGSTSGPTACSFSLTGGHTEPTTAAPFGCANTKIEQVSGQGDFTASIGGTFAGAAGGTVSLACTLSSATPPAAGAKWTMSKATHSQGNCTLTVISGTTATMWAASANDATLTGALELTFVNVTMVHGTANPTDVYYLYELTLTATLPGLTAGATDVTVAGAFKNMTLPIGS